MTTPTLIQLTTSLLPIRTMLESGLLDLNAPLRPETMEALEERLTLENFILEGLFEEELDPKVLELAYLKFNHNFIWSYLEKLYPDPRGKTASNIDNFLMIPTEPHLEIITDTQVVAINRILQHRQYKVTVEEALDKVYLEFQKDLIVLLSVPGTFQLKAMNSEGIIWDFHDNQYRLFVYNLDVPTHYSPIVIFPGPGLLTFERLDDMVNAIIDILVKSRSYQTLTLIQSKPQPLKERDRVILGSMEKLISPKIKEGLIKTLCDQRSFH